MLLPFFQGEGLVWGDLKLVESGNSIINVQPARARVCPAPSDTCGVQAGKEAVVLGGTSAPAGVGLPITKWQWQGADRLGEEAPKAWPCHFHDGVSWQASLGEGEQNLDQSRVTDDYRLFVAEPLPGFGVGEEQNCNGGLGLNCEVRPLGGDEFLGSQEAVEP